MRTLIKILLSAIIVSQALKLQAQQKGDDPCSYIREAIKYNCEKKYSRSLKSLEAFRKKYPAHRLAVEALYAEAKIYVQLKKYRKAESLFNSIVDLKNYREHDSSQTAWTCTEYREPCSYILMQQDLITIQHESCIQLAEIGFATKNPDLAYRSIYNADKYYRYWYGCGTSDQEETMRLSLLYARYLVNAGLQDSALKVLLPNILEPAALPMNYYKDLLAKGAELLKLKFTTTELKKMLDTAIDSLEFETNSPMPGKENRIYFIRFYNMKLQVAPVYLFAGNRNPEEVKEYIRNSDFYTRLTTP